MLIAIIFGVAGYALFSNITSKYCPDQYVKCVICDEPVYLCGYVPMFNLLDSSPRNVCNECITSEL